jgi:hypothetical protein
VSNPTSNDRQPSAEERLYIGELVDWLAADPLDDWPEVTVIGPLEWIHWELVDRPWESGTGWGYSVTYRCGTQGCELAKHLRRKHLPPNPDSIETTDTEECCA